MNARLRSLVLVLVWALAAAAAHAAPFENTIAQRTQACTACHGAQGRAAPDGYYPRLAGKPAGYLYNQLLNFRDGRRHYALMTQLVDPLTDAYLMEIANYFAGLDLPYPPPAAPSAAADVLQRGRTLALQGDASRRVPACASCHGQNLTGAAPQVPGLLGLPRDYLNAQLGAWRTGKRRAHAPDCMAQIVARMSDDDIHAATSWLAAQPVPRGASAAAAASQAPAREAGAACGSATPPQATAP